VCYRRKRWRRVRWSGRTAPKINGRGASRRNWQADRFHLDFADTGKAKLLQATGNVRVERAATGKALQTATGHNGVAQLDANGGWSQMELHGT